ncbi:MAG: hypothetical protein IT425_14325 [Pirellulales bacterium]|nr:hypothetical protein [Pirellulales bacterium]
MLPVPPPTLLLGINLVEIGLAVMVVLFAIIKQLVEANQAANKKRERPRPVPQPQREPVEPPRGMVNAGAGGGQQADPLRGQVEEFLRRAGRLPEAEQPASPREIEKRRPPSPEPKTRRLVEAPPPIAGKPSQSASSAERERRSKASGKKRKSVAEHVAEAVTSHSQSLGQQASRLGERIVREDEQFDVQLKARFDHKLGTLGENPVAQPATSTAFVPADTPAGQIAAMLASPEGVRQAVLLNEILRRPSERW